MILPRFSWRRLLRTALYIFAVIDAVTSSNHKEGTEESEVELGKIVAARPYAPSANDTNCQCESLDPPDPKSTGARLAYLITVHNHRTAEDAAYLFRAIRAPRNIVLIHVDTKFDWSEYTSTTLHLETEECPCGATVHVGSVHSAKWSSWSMNDPTFWGMETAVSLFGGQWDVFLNLSGDTMPVFTTEIMSRLFDQKHGPLRGTNFVTSSSCETGLVPTNVYVFPEFWHKRGHYTNNPKGDPLIRYVDDEGNEQEMKLVIHFGSQWMALLPDFVEYLVSSLKRPHSLPSRFKEELIRTKRLMTDETFIPTLLMHVSPFNETLPILSEDGSLQSLPSMSSIRYERMDEQVPTAFGFFPTQQRYEVPESSSADKPRPWGPYFLGVYDLDNIKESGALFVRKVSVSIDPNIVRMLPVSNINDLPSIQWPNEIQISEKPDWEKIRAELIRKAEEKRAKKDAAKASSKDVKDLR